MPLLANGHLGPWSASPTRTPTLSTLSCFPPSRRSLTTNPDSECSQSTTATTNTLAYTRPDSTYRRRLLQAAKYPQELPPSRHHGPGKGRPQGGRQRSHTSITAPTGASALQLILEYSQGITSFQLRRESPGCPPIPSIAAPSVLDPCRHPRTTQQSA